MYRPEQRNSKASQEYSAHMYRAGLSRPTGGGERRGDHGENGSSSTTVIIDLYCRPARCGASGAGEGGSTRSVGLRWTDEFVPVAGEGGGNFPWAVGAHRNLP